MKKTHVSANLFILIEKLYYSKGSRPRDKDENHMLAIIEQKLCNNNKKCMISTSRKGGKSCYIRKFDSLDDDRNEI